MKYSIVTIVCQPYIRLQIPVVQVTNAVNVFFVRKISRQISRQSPQPLSTCAQFSFRAPQDGTTWYYCSVTSKSPAPESPERKRARSLSQSSTANPFSRRCAAVRYSTTQHQTRHFQPSTDSANCETSEVCMAKLVGVLHTVRFCTLQVPNIGFKKNLEVRAGKEVQ
jgi:hypothetical protein